MKPIYIPNFIDNPNEVFANLLALDWLEMTPARKEYFMADTVGLVYSYGSESSKRSYTSKPYNESVGKIRQKLDETYSTDYNVCFLNRYDNFKNSLDYHSDNSPEMNSEHPISVISFGAEREIWWKHKNHKGVIPADQKQRLGNGSLFIMPAKFQEDYLHKIPKADSQRCGCRISLTFRNYK